MRRDGCLVMAVLPMVGLLFGCAEFRAALGDVESAAVATCKALAQDAQDEPGWLKIACLSARTLEPVIMRVANPSPELKCARSQLVPSASAKPAASAPPLVSAGVNPSPAPSASGVGF